MEEIKKRVEYIEMKLEKLKNSCDKLKSEVTNNNSDETYIILRAIERDSEEIVECSVRINQDILEKKGKLASTYRESFLLLKELKIFENEFLEELGKTVIFRNKLAHEYMGMEDNLVIKNSQKILDLYPKYLLKIIEFIEKK
jgi:uncharacterized protein YutE (UPF0331/DUF86 family)